MPTVLRMGTEMPTLPARRAWTGSLVPAVVIFGILAVTWLAFGQALFVLGHHGDSWTYVARMEASGPFSIIAWQQARLALPLAWGVGFSIAGAEPWIYNGLSIAFVAASAVCWYALVVRLAPQARLFAFATAVLSVLWPSDPTRYDAATLGNRQALFFFVLGALAYVVALQQHRRQLAFLASAALTISLLTYEAQVLLILGLPVLGATLRVRAGRPTRWLLCPVLVPVAIDTLANAAAIALAPGQRTYQSVTPVELTLPHVLGQLAAAVHVLAVDAWQSPLVLLATNNVPDWGLVALGVSVVVVCLGALIACEPTPSNLPEWRSAAGLLVLCLPALVLSLAVFAASSIPLSQPDRVHTFALSWTALFFCAALDLLVQRTIKGTYFRQFAFAALCVPLVIVFFCMAGVYQRNYRQSWFEQRTILSDLISQAPDIEDGTLVLISGLPDTRIIFVSGYTCEYALGYLAGHAPLQPFRDTAEELALHRINCGLLFDGRSLDQQVRVEFRTTGVLDSFQRFQWEFPYNRLLMFRYTQEGHLVLLDHLPAELLPEGFEPIDYAPRALIRARSPRREAVRLLGRSVSL